MINWNANEVDAVENMVNITENDQFVGQINFYGQSPLMVNCDDNRVKVQSLLFKCDVYDHIACWRSILLTILRI
jgi:hypothetical protein